MAPFGSADGLVARAVERMVLDLLGLRPARGDRRPRWATCGVGRTTRPAARVRVRHGGRGAGLDPARRAGGRGRGGGLAGGSARVDQRLIGRSRRRRPASASPTPNVTRRPETGRRVGHVSPSDHACIVVVLAQASLDLNYPVRMGDRRVGARLPCRTLARTSTTTEWSVHSYRTQRCRGLVREVLSTPNSAAWKALWIRRFSDRGASGAVPAVGPFHDQLRVAWTGHPCELSTGRTAPEASSTDVPEGRPIRARVRSVEMWMRARTPRC